MKKILDLLEQRVEWLVLAVGLAFAGYIAWAYVIDSPVYVDLDGRQTPATVDDTILNGPAQALDTAMHKNSNQAAITPPHFVEDFRDTMNYAKAGPTTAPSSDALVIWPQTPPIKFSDLPSLAGNPGASANPGEAAPPGSGTVVQLPKVPTPQLIATRSDMSYVAVPGQQPAQLATPTTDDPVAAVAPAAPVVPMVGMDKTWASVLYTIDTAALAKEWEQCHFPPNSIMTVFMQVQLERQELKPDGTWSDPVVLPPLAVGVNIPSAPKTATEALGFISWAKNHQPDIVRPDFYKMIKGRQWAPPGLDAPIAQTTDKFDPSKYLTAKPADLMKLTPDQRQLVQKAIADKKADAAKSRRGSGNSGSGSGATGSQGTGGLSPGDPLGGGGGGASQEINDPDRPASYLVADPTAAANAGAPANPAGRGANTPQPRPAATPGAAPGIAQLVAYPIPAGEFDPSKWADDHPQAPLIVGWAHDDTVQPSHTYRYRISYRLKNPVMFATSAVKDPNLANQFDLRSAPSEWSQNVEIRSAVNFWLVTASDTSGVASVDVFRWQGGDAKKKTFKVSAGDMIGGKEGNIDYATGWTVVDMRVDPRTNKIYVLLMDPSGLIHRRDVDADTSDPKYIELKQQSTNTTASR